MKIFIIKGKKSSVNDHLQHCFYVPC